MTEPGPITVGITGGFGQFGFMARSRLERHHGLAVRAAGRETLEDPARLRAFVKGCDAIIHAAGVNRADEETIRSGNLAPAQALTAALTAEGAAPHLLYASSTQRDRGNVYGQAKAAAAEVLGDWAGRAGARFAEVVLPNLFGEFTRPNYNSFIGTLCHCAAHEQAAPSASDDPVRLLHYVDAADVFAEAIRLGKTGRVDPAATEIIVSEAARMIASFHADYRQGIIPDLRDPFALRLFNSYRSALPPERWPFMLERKSDQRGSLFECVKERNGGQVFYSSTKPGVTRGDHFHFEKVERFLVVSGEARIRVRKLYGDETRVYDVSGDAPCFVDMPTLCTHNITNTGSGDLLTLFWAHDIFDPERPDTYREPV